MKAFLVTIGIVSVIVTGVALADRVYTVTSASAKVTHMTVVPLPDGGVYAEVCGQAMKAGDAGVGAAGCYKWDLTGPAQTVGLGLMARGLAKWVAEEGL